MKGIPSGSLVLLPLAGDGWAEVCGQEARARIEARNRKSLGERKPREGGGDRKLGLVTESDE